MADGRRRGGPSMTHISDDSGYVMWMASPNHHRQSHDGSFLAQWLDRGFVWEVAAFPVIMPDADAASAKAATGFCTIAAFARLVCLLPLRRWIAASIPF